jgi:putative membrane protein
MSGLVMTFYVLFFGTVFTFFNALATGTFQPLSSWWELLMAVLLAVITAVLSNLTLVLAIQRIGSTLTSVLGVMEPLTAVFVGILVFGEPFTPALAAGVLLIIFSVTLVMLGRQAEAMARRILRKGASA